MGVFSGPDVSESGLVLALDAGNPKSYDGRENLLLYSQALATSPWAIFNVGGTSILNNTIVAPDGNTTASTFTIGTAADSIYQDVSVSGTGTYTFSIFVKAGTSNQINITGFFIFNTTQNIGDCRFNPITGQIVSGTGKVESYPNGWYRVSVTGTGNNSLNNTFRAQIYGDGTGTVYFWGAQVEKNSTATTYAATTTTAITRPTTWTDLSVLINTGTLTNGPTYNSANGGSIVFDGVDDYIRTSNTGISHGTSNWSYSLWVNHNTLPGLGTYIENGLYTNGILIRFETSSVSIYSQGSGWGSFSFTPTIGSWYYLNFVRNGNNILFYVNGVYQSQIAFTANISPSTSFIFIGSSQHTINQCFNGRISQVQIRSRALTASEVQQNYNATKSRFGL